MQQDFALAALVGATHVERNGHHFVHGFGTSTQAEQEAFLAAHGDLYEKYANGRVRLAIRDGAVSFASLHVPGSAAPVEPNWPGSHSPALVGRLKETLISAPKGSDFTRPLLQSTGDESETNGYVSFRPPGLRSRIIKLINASGAYIPIPA